MAGVSKKVYFVGAWKTPSIPDQLLRQITTSMASKKAYEATLTLTTAGLELAIQQNGRITGKDLIALENIVDFLDNKYNTKCILAIVRDDRQKQYTVFGFLCKSDRDAAETLHSFRTFKRKLSGEGYNVDVRSKGQNWTLVTNGQTKNNGGVTVQIPKQNGDVRIVNVEKRNGNSVVHAARKTSDTNQSVKSKSEMKQELNQLAGEIRDIKQLIQTQGSTEVIPATSDRNHDFHQSKGRLQFEKHYGYKILPAKRTVQHVQTVKRVDSVPMRPDYPDVVATMAPAKRQTVYLKNAKVKNGTTGRSKHVVAVSQPARVIVNRPSRRPQQYNTVPSTPGSTISGYSVVSRRVYDSANPYLESGKGSPHVNGKNYTLVATNRTQRFQARSPVRKTKSHGTDIVQKSIENVYRPTIHGRTRAMRRVIVPPPAVTPSVMDYVNVQSQQSPAVSVQPVQDDSERRIEYVEDVVTDEPLHVRGVYESREGSERLNEEVNISQVSTMVKTDDVAVDDDGLDDNVILKGDGYTYTRHSGVQQEDGNVIIVKADTQNMNVESRGNREYVRYVDNYSTASHETAKSTGGGVYHVKAESVTAYQRHGNTSGMTVISPEDNDVRTVSEHYRFNDQKGDPAFQSSVVVVHDNEVHASYTREEPGLFESYGRKSEENYDKNTDIVAEHSYRFRDGDGDAVVTRGSNQDIRVQHVKHTENEMSSIVTSSENTDTNSERRVHYDHEDHVIEHYEDDRQYDFDENADVAEHGTKTTSIIMMQEQKTVSHTDFHDELKSKVQKLKSNNNGDKDEPYVMNMEALRKSMEEPDLVIIDSDETSKTARVKGESGSSKSGFKYAAGAAAVGAGVATVAGIGGGFFSGGLNGNSVGDAVMDYAKESEIGTEVQDLAQGIYDKADGDAVQDFGATVLGTGDGLNGDAIGEAMADYAKETEIGTEVKDLAQGVYDKADGDAIQNFGASALGTGDGLNGDAIGDAMVDYAKESEIGNEVQDLAQGIYDKADGDAIQDFGATALGAGDNFNADAIGDAAVDYAKETEIGTEVQHFAEDMFDQADGGAIQNVGETVVGEGTSMLPEGLTSDNIGDAATDFAKNSELGSEVKEFAEGVYDKADGDAVMNFAGEDDIGDKVKDFAQDVFNGDGADIDSPIDMAKGALETDAVADIAGKSELGRTTLPFAQDVVTNGLPSTSELGDSAKHFAKDALNSETVTDLAGKSGVTDKVIPLAKKYLDEDQIKEITSRTEESVLF